MRSSSVWVVVIPNSEAKNGNTPRASTPAITAPPTPKMVDQRIVSGPYKVLRTLKNGQDLKAEDEGDSSDETEE